MHPVRHAYLKTAYKDLAVSALVFAFGLIYEYFGFGVTSPYMHLAFLLPLVAGALIMLTLALFVRKRPYAAMSVSFWHAGIATLTVGSLFHGALDIYGTTSPLTRMYLIAGVICMAVAFVFFIARPFDKLRVRCGR